MYAKSVFTNSSLRLCREPAASGGGMMEYWNVGMLGLVQRIYSYKDGTDQYVKSDRHPLCIPNIPLFHWESEVNFTPLSEL